MPPLVSVLNREELDSFPHEVIQAELNNWQQILFYGDMDGYPNSGDKRHDQTINPDASSSSSPPNENRNIANVHQTNAPYFPAHGSPPQIQPETYNYLIHALLSLQGSAPHPYPQNHPGTYPHTTQPSSLLQFTPPNYGWPSSSDGAQLMPAALGSPSFFPSNAPVPLAHGAAPQNIASSSQLPPPPVTVPSNASPEQDPDQTEEGVPTTEDKRRRNTAASARFRIKKKQKTLNLERTVSDLSGRTEELEREAAELRRENGWLKEIVLLKGKKLAASSQLASSAARDSQEENDHTESESESREKRNDKGKGKAKER